MNHNICRGEGRIPAWESGSWKGVVGGDPSSSAAHSSTCHITLGRMPMPHICRSLFPYLQSVGFRSKEYKTMGTRLVIILPTIRFLLCSRCYIKCFTCIISFHPCNKPERSATLSVFHRFRYGEPSRSGNNCHWEDSLLLKSFQELGAHHVWEGHTGEVPGLVRHAD